MLAAAEHLRRFRYWWTYRSPWGRVITRIQARICGETPEQVADRDEEAGRLRRTAEVKR